MTPQAVYSPEVLLPGGTTNAGLVRRVGDTVRRPRRPSSESTAALLDHLQRVGFEGAPRHLGSDSRGREVFAYIPGRVPIAPTPRWALTDPALASVAELLRGYHDAVVGFDPAGHRWAHAVPRRFRDGTVTHNDPNLDNIVFRGGRAVALLDFDLAAPGSRAWDLACAARLWIPLREPGDRPSEVRGRMLERLALFVEAYGASRDQRAEFLEALPECHRWCYSIVLAAVAEGQESFCRQWAEGAGERAERTGRWLAQCAPALRSALRV